MESPNAALEHRVSHLESIVGEELAVDSAAEPSSLLSALHDTFQLISANVSPERSDMETTMLRRFRFLREHGVPCDDLSDVAVEEAVSQVESLERAFSKLAVLSPVLDRDWDIERVRFSRVEEALVDANKVADAAEEAIERESQALDTLLIDYNNTVKNTNAHFLRLEGLVQEVERRHAARRKARNPESAR